jgi:hypothetical protein
VRESEFRMLLIVRSGCAPPKGVRGDGKSIAALRVRNEMKYEALASRK